MRRRLLLLAAFSLFTLTALPACSRYAGPLERPRDRVDARAPDGRPYTIAEQQQRGRERQSITEDDYRIGPKAYIDRPSPTGR